MSEPVNKPAYLVDAYSDPVLVRVEGRACFTNSASLHDFFARMHHRGKSRFVVDFQNCTSMDSTFLGVLAGEALELKRDHPGGSLVLCRLGRRNLELVRNLGLHRLLTVDAGTQAMSFDHASEPLEESRRDTLERAHLVLEAHENLVNADPANLGRFQDVMVFLRSRVGNGSRDPGGTGGR